MQENDYIVLLHKQLTGEISPAEQKTLNEWLGQSVENQGFADDLRIAWEKSAGFEKTFQPDLDAAFRQLQVRIQAAPASSPLRVLTFRRQLLRVAAAAAVLIFGLWGYQQFSGSVAAPESLVVSSSAGNSEVLLPDGTRVWLRKGARMEYPAAFAGRERTVRLQGEAYFEVARTEMIRNLGMAYSELERKWGIMLPVREANVQYRRPVRYDENIILLTQIRQKPERRIRFDTSIFNEAGELTTEGFVELVFVSTENMRPCKPPQAFLDLIAIHWIE